MATTHATRGAAYEAGSTVPKPTKLELTLMVTLHKMRQARRAGAPGAYVDLEELAAQVAEQAIEEQHAMVLSAAQDPANPTAQEQRWAEGLAASVAGRLHRTTRKMLRSLKATKPTPRPAPARDATTCPSWCVRHTSGFCDWHESRPVAFEGPGDFYAETPEPLEIMWAVLSETPPDAVQDGQREGSYIFFDTLGDGSGARLNVAETDALIRQLTRYTERLQDLRDQLAAQPNQITD